MACIGDAAALSMDDLAVAAGGGDYAAALRVVDRLFLEGVSPIVVLRGLQRHFQRLHQAAAAVARGTSVDQALGGLKPPPHFRLAAAMRGQLARWPLDRLASALDLLVKTEIDGKTTGMPAQALCARAVLQLTRAGGRRAGGRR